MYLTFWCIDNEKKWMQSYIFTYFSSNLCFQDEPNDDTGGSVASDVPNMGLDVANSSMPAVIQVSNFICDYLLSQDILHALLLYEWHTYEIRKHLQKVNELYK